MQPAATILIVKSGISNHAASGILDELCLSKFGTFHAACPPIVCELPDTLRGLSKPWKDAAFDAGRGTEELPGFYSKEFAAAGYIGTLWFPHFLSTAYLRTLSRLPGLSNTALPF